MFKKGLIKKERCVKEFAKDYFSYGIKRFKGSLLKGGVSLVMSLFFVGAAQAEVLTAHITFDKKPAKAGLLYVVGSGAETHAELNQKNKKFSRNMVVVSPGSTLKLKNSDTLKHNIFVNDFKTGVKFDVGLMPVGGTIDKEIDWPEDVMLRVGCKIHPTMKAYVANVQAQVFEALEFDRKQSDYSYTLSDVVLTEGRAKVRLSMVKYDAVELDLKKGESVEVDLVKKGKKRGSAVLELK